MELNDKIKANLTEQVRIRRDANELQGKLRELDNDMNRTQGAMEVLAQMYEEVNGRELQKDLNQDPEWGEWLRSLTQEPQPEQPAPPAPTNNGPKLRAVSDNKKVAAQPTEAQIRQAEMAQPVPEPGGPVVRKRQGVQVTIDDAPPGPDTPDKPDPS